MHTEADQFVQHQSQPSIGAHVIIRNSSSMSNNDVAWIERRSSIVFEVTENLDRMSLECKEPPIMFNVKQSLIHFLPTKCNLSILYLRKKIDCYDGGPYQATEIY